MAKGECNCGAVAFQVDTELTDVYYCHCSICRRATGANGIAVLVVNNESFRWTRGEDQVTSWKKPNAHWEMWFCQVCHSPVPGINDDKRMFIPAGLIREGSENLKVVHHLYVDSKAPWDEIGDSGKQHGEGFQTDSS